MGFPFSFPTDIQQMIGAELGLKIRNSNPLGGGCIHNAQKLQTDNGLFFLECMKVGQGKKSSNTFFPQIHNQSSYHNFEVEAKGLEFLAQNSSFSIPQVHLLS